MSNTKIFLPMLALMLCLGAFLFPVTASAKSNEDTTPPTVTATLSGDMLKVEAKDDNSGVAAIYINEHCFATLVNGTANIRLKDYAGTGKQVSVYAIDAEGNRSQAVLIDNPYFQASAPTAPAPATPAPSTPAPSPTPSPSAPVISAPSPDPLEQPQEPADSAVPGDTNTDGTATDSAIPDTAFTPDGTGTVMDNATETDGKEFFTITSESGNVYYLVIDRQRGTENVFFLNAVTEEDLLGLAQSTDGAVPTAPGTVNPDPQPTAPATPDPQPTPEQPAPSGGNTGAIIFVLLAVVAVGGAAYYFKIVKPRKQAAVQDEDEYEDEPDEAEAYEENYYFDDETED